MNDKFKKYFQFVLVILAAGSIYPLVYLRTGYSETILEVFNMTGEQLNNIYTVIGLVFVVGYFPSGWIADKISPKKLLSISLLGTGISGVWLSTIPNYNGVVFAYILFGIFSVFTFWGAHLKIVTMLSEEGQEGKYFGILDGGKGLVEAVLALAALAIFTSILGSSTDLETKSTALKGVISMYSYALIAISVFIFIFVDEGKENTGTSKEKTSFSEEFKKVTTLFKNKFVWINGGIIFFSYIMAYQIYYLTGFLQNNIGYSAVSAATLGAIILWMRPIGGAIGGYLGDIFGRAKILAIALIIAAFTSITVALLPTTLTHMGFNALILIIALTIYVIRGLYWSIVSDAKIPTNLMGTAIGLISFIGYLPDMLIPQINTQLFKAFGDTGGYNAYFIFNSFAAIAGVILIIVFVKTLKKENN